MCDIRLWQVRQGAFPDGFVVIVVSSAKEGINWCSRIELVIGGVLFGDYNWKEKRKIHTRSEINRRGRQVLFCWKKGEQIRCSLVASLIGEEIGEVKQQQKEVHIHDTTVVALQRDPTTRSVKAWSSAAVCDADEWGESLRSHVKAQSSCCGDAFEVCSSQWRKVVSCFVLFTKRLKSVLQGEIKEKKH